MLLHRGVVVIEGLSIFAYSGTGGLDNYAVGLEPKDGKVYIDMEVQNDLFFWHTIWLFFTLNISLLC